MNKYNVQLLFDTIATDLKIKKLDVETELEYRCRLVYSAIGYWCLNIVRDKYEKQEQQVSKSHVTITLMDTLNSYLHIDSELKEYFNNIKTFVKVVEDTYYNVGYIDAGKYSFKNMGHKQRIILSEQHSLLIRNYIRKPVMIGLGLIKPIKPNDITLDEFFSIQLNSQKYFVNLLKNLKFDSFNDEFGKIEIYNIEKNRWEYFNERQGLRYEYSILKIDDGLEYGLLKKAANQFLYSKLPIIYSKQCVDNYFLREVWRIILGVCSYNKIPAKAYVTKKGNEALIYKMYGYAIPENEMSIIRCISWPLGHACYSDNSKIDGFLVLNEYEQLMNKILNRFDISIQKE